MSLLLPSSVKSPFLCPQCNFILNTKGEWYNLNFKKFCSSKILPLGFKV